MRNLNKSDKDLIRSLTRIEMSKNVLLKDIFQGILEEGKYAVLINEDNIHLFCNEGDGSACEIQQLIIHHISLLEQLENEGYIYLIIDESRDSFFLQGKVKQEVWCDGNILKCYLGDIIKSNNSFSIPCKNGKYEEIPLSKNMGSQLNKFIRSIVYPTDKLYDFVKNGFLSEDAVKYKKNYHIALGGLVVSLAALFVSIGAPFWMTCYTTKYNNDNAITTIDTSQISSVTKRLDEIILQVGNDINEIRKYDSIGLMKQRCLKME